MMITTLFALALQAAAPAPAPTAVSTPPAAAPARAPADQEVAIGEGAKTLRGSLMAPPGATAAVLFVSGSGPTDRNGNQAQLPNNSIRNIAEALSARGVATLRVDKRGVAASAAAAPDENELRFGTYVTDIEAWAADLKARTGARCVYLAGHSEGALIATLAAKKVRPCGLILMAGAGGKAGALLRSQLAKTLPPIAARQAGELIAQLETGKKVAYIPPQMASLFRPSVQNYLISWLPLDPAAELKSIDTPTLILQGDNDFQVGVEDARLLAAARPDARLVIIKGANHLMRPAPTERQANFQTYLRSDIAPSPEVVGEIMALIGRTGG